MERLRHGIKFEGTSGKPKSPNIGKVSLEVRDFESLKSSSAYILALGAEYANSSMQNSGGINESPSFDISEFIRLYYKKQDISKVYLFSRECECSNSSKCGWWSCL